MTATITDINKKKLSIEKAHNEHQASLKSLEHKKLRVELYVVRVWLESMDEVTDFCMNDDFTPPGMMEGHKSKIRERRDVILDKLNELDGE